MITHRVFHLTANFIEKVINNKDIAIKTWENSLKLSYNNFKL